MPFYGYTPIPAADGKPTTQSATHVEWHVREWQFVEADTRVASVRIGEESFALVICFPAMIQQLLAAEGSTVAPGTDVLRWLADGESIPYGKTHFRLDAAA